MKVLCGYSRTHGFDLRVGHTSSRSCGRGGTRRGVVPCASPRDSLRRQLRLRSRRHLLRYLLKSSTAHLPTLVNDAPGGRRWRTRPDIVRSIGRANAPMLGVRTSDFEVVGPYASGSERRAECRPSHALHSCAIPMRRASCAPRQYRAAPTKKARGGTIRFRGLLKRRVVYVFQLDESRSSIPALQQ